MTDADEATTPMEALLFSFGVGVGVMCTVKSSESVAEGSRSSSGDP